MLFRRALPLQSVLLLAAAASADDLLIPADLSPAPHRTVLLGTVVGVAADPAEGVPEMPVLAPIYTVDVRDVLSGAARRREVLRDTHAFVREQERWYPRATSPAPWLAPGQDVLLVIDDGDPAAADSTRPQPLRVIRNAWFLQPHPFADEPLLMEQVGVDGLAPEQLDSDPGATIEGLLSGLTFYEGPAPVSFAEVMRRFRPDGG